MMKFRSCFVSTVLRAWQSHHVTSSQHHVTSSQRHVTSLQRHVTSLQDHVTSRQLSTMDVAKYEITRDGLRDRTTNQTILHFESRHCCKCPVCWNKHSNQITTAHSDDTVKLTGIKGSSDHYLNVEWSDGHEGQIAVTGRGIYGNGEKDEPNEEHYQVTLRRSSHQKYWHNGDNPSISRSFYWEEVMSSDEAVREFLLHFMVYGLAFLKHVPKGKNISGIVNDDIRCGPLWSTIFGEYSEVKSMVNPSNEAYGNEFLPAHIDLPYYTQPPSAYFFLCARNECEGGECLWVDAFAILDKLRRERPDYFAALCEVDVAFRAYSPGLNNAHVAGSYPTVELTKSGELHRVRDLFFTRDNYRTIRDVDTATRARWWEAYSYFRQQIEKPDNQLIRKLESQELVIIDNWRVMHGRHEFKLDKDNEGKARLMEVAYGDWNHLQSRVLHQK